MSLMNDAGPYDTSAPDLLLVQHRKFVQELDKVNLKRMSLSLTHDARSLTAVISLSSFLSLVIRKRTRSSTGLLST